MKTGPILSIFLESLTEAADTYLGNVKIIWCKNCESVTGLIVGDGDELVNGQGVDANDLACPFCGDNASMMSEPWVLVERWGLTPALTCDEK